MGSPADGAVSDDPADNELVEFGGFGSSSAPQPITWVNTSSGWENVTGDSSAVPPACEFCAMSYDVADEEVVLFDQGTWVFHAQTWEELAPSTSPPLSLTREAMAYNWVGAELTLYGGTYTASSCGCTVSTDGATWVWDGTTWANVTAQSDSAPGALVGASMAFDHADTSLVLFGGLDATSVTLTNATWFWHDGVWDELYVPSPSPRAYARMTYDATDGYVVLYGGVGCGTPPGACGDTWKYLHEVWTQLEASGSPPTALPGVELMSYDTASGYVVLLEENGGATTPYSWPSPLTTAISAPSTSVDVNQSIAVDAAAWGGAPPLSVEWTDLPQGCSNVDSSYLNCTPAENGGYDLKANVTDASGRYHLLTLDLNIFTDPSVPLPTPNLAQADIGSSVSFISPAKGGTGVYSYTWSAPAWLDCGTNLQPTLDCVPQSQGKASVSVQVSDSNGFVAASPVRTYVVNQPPTVILSENRSLMDVAELISFNAVASGGSGGYTYSYNGLPAGCSSLNSPTLTCSPSVAGTFTVWAFVNDSDSVMAESSEVSFSVNADPLLGLLFDQGSNFTEANATWDVVLTVSGGSPNFVECDSTQQAGVGVQCLTGSGVSIHMSFPYWTAGTYFAVFSARDATGWNTTHTVEFNVFYPPDLGTPSVPPADTGQTVTLTTWEAHGAPTLRSWWNDSTDGIPLCPDVPSQPGQTLSCSFSATWSTPKTVNLTVRDALGIQRSVEVVVSTNPPPTSSLVDVPAEVPVGFDFTLSVSTTGGTSPYTFCTEVPAWWTAPRCILHSAATEQTFAYPGGSSPSRLMIGVSVEDTAGINETLWTNVSLVPDLSAPTVSGTLWSYEGSMATVNTTISTGVPVYSVWFNDTTSSLPLCSVLTVYAPGEVTCTFELDWSGAHSLQVTIRDVFGEHTSSSATFQGFAPLSISSATAATGSSLASSGHVLSAEVGAPVYLNATFRGGNGSLQYSWWVGGMLIAEGNGSASGWNAIWDPTLTGTVLALFDVVDSAGTPDSVSVPIQVGVALSLVVLTSSLDPVDLGLSTNLSLSYSGGARPLSYAWSIETDVGVWRTTVTEVPWLSWDWVVPGTFEVVSSVYDADHAGRWAFTNVTVDPAISLSCAPLLLSTHDTAGSLLNFTLSCVAGGTPPVNFTWNWGDGTPSTVGSTAASHTYAEPGNYSVSVVATDALAQRTASPALQVQVVPPPRATTPAPGPKQGGFGWGGFSWTLLLDLLLAGVLVVLVALWLWSRDRRPPTRGRSSSPSDDVEEGEGHAGNERGEDALARPAEISEEELRRSGEIDAAIVRVLGERKSSGLAEMMADLGVPGVSDPELLEHLFALKKSGRVVVLPESEEKERPIFALAPGEAGRGGQREMASLTVDESMLNDFLARRESAFGETASEPEVAEED